MLESVTSFWPQIVAVLSVMTSLWSSAHAVMYKRESRAATAWFGLSWLVPFLGPVLYLMLGINRVRRRAMAKREFDVGGPTQANEPEAVRPTDLDALWRLVERVAVFPAVSGNQVLPLRNGDEAYPAMIAAIDAAAHSVILCSYIFDNDRAGRRFSNALAAAVQRGVEVRVMIDDIGARYSMPSIVGELRRGGIKVARFGRSLWPWRMRYANLRNHRKILVIDNKVGFTGGMNIRQGSILREESDQPTADLHFRLQGPVVGQLHAVATKDWRLMTGECLDAAAPGSPAEPVGSARARCLPDGPDRPDDGIRWTLLGAVACSAARIRIVTPYFVPDAGIISALCTAALRGIEVEIVLPEANNLRIVKWATAALLWQVLENGCRVFYSPAPFDHSKLLLVDSGHALIGSANWDARSLRLNYEVNVMIQDDALCDELHRLVDSKLQAAREVTLAEVDARPRHIRLRDGLARLLSPYI